MDSPLTVHLHSFGYRYSGVPTDESGHGGGFVFDCRCLPNPYWDEALRPHTGLEPVIAAFMEEQPESEAFAHHAAGLVLPAAAAYAGRGHERLMVAFGCTGGRHRSVYHAQRLAAALEAVGHRVVVTHVDLERPATAPPQ